MAVYGDIAKWQFLKDDGTLASGWKLNTYESGTTTPKATFTDTDGTVFNSNPVIADSRGEMTVLFEGSYKLVLTDENDVVKWTIDNYKTESASTIGAIGNIILNGSFETDTDESGTPDGWTLTAGDTTARDIANSIHGVASMKFTSIGGGGGSLISTDFFEVSDGRGLPISFALISTVANVHNVVEIFWFDENKVALSTSKTAVYNDTATNPTVWTYKWVHTTAPSGAKFAKLKIQGATSSGATGTTNFDNVVIDGTYSNDQTITTMTGNLTGNVTGNVTGNLTGNADTASTATAVVNAGAGGALKAKILNIGTWDMNAVSVFSVVHGLNSIDIRQVKALILHDTDAGNISDLQEGVSATDATQQGFVSNITATTIVLTRLTGGTFDTTNYDTLVNRGYITIWYV